MRFQARFKNFRNPRVIARFVRFAGQYVGVMEGGFLQGETVISPASPNGLRRGSLPLWVRLGGAGLAKAKFNEPLVVC